MTTYKLLFDEDMTFLGYNKQETACHLRIYIPDYHSSLIDDAAAIAVVSELPSNHNTSITNRIEHITVRAAETHPELQGVGFRLFEHWCGRRVPPERNPDRLRWPIPDETFSEVSFPRRVSATNLGEPAWRYMRREALEEIIGMSFAPVPGCEKLEGAQ